MKNFIGAFLVSVVLASLLSCTSPDNIKPSAIPNYSTEGYVAIKIYGNGKEFRPSHMFQVVLREVDSFKYKSFFGDEIEYQVFRLPVGTYYVGDIFPSSPQVMLRYRDDKYDETLAIPFKPFKVIPGQTLYLGDVVVEGVRYNTFIDGKSDYVTYTVSNNSDVAKAAILKKIHEIDPAYQGDFVVKPLEMLR